MRLSMILPCIVVSLVPITLQADPIPDFRVKLQAADEGKTGRAAGPVTYTPFISDKSAYTDWAFDHDKFDPDTLKIGLEVNPDPKKKLVLKDHDIRFWIQLCDTEGKVTGQEQPTPWASEEGEGWSEFALDDDGWDFDGARIRIEARPKPGFTITDLRLGMKLADSAGQNGHGSVVFTPWLSNGGGWSALAGDDDFWDADAVAIKIEMKKE